MLGLSYGELFLIIGATAAVIGPKDLPRIARVAGRLAGRSIGYIQMARGQFDNVMQNAQTKQLHKDLQEAMAQMEAMRHELRMTSFMNPGPSARSLMENIGLTPETNGSSIPDKPSEDPLSTTISKVYTTTSSEASPSSNMISQATAYARLAESAALHSETRNNEVLTELTDESGLTVLPISAQDAKSLPDFKGDAKGSDIMLESILEAEVAIKAKEFFANPQNLTRSE